MRTVLSRGILLLGLAAAVALPAGAVTPLSFDDPAKQERYERLLEELRCLVCQNESLASSDADLAGDLRREVYRLVEQGKSNSEVKQYLVNRYGEFVLYRPRVTAKTYLLWFGPALLAVVGIAVLVVAIRRRARETSRTDLDPAERQRLDSLLDEYGDER